METAYEERIDRLEREVRRLDRELAELRLYVFPEEAAQPPVRDSGPVEGVWGNREVPPVRDEEGVRGSREVPPVRDEAPEPGPVTLFPAPKPFELPAAALRAPRRSLELSDLLGAKALAWVGGGVMLLGVVFFYVLAVNRGW